jgi:hypothetical protein
MRTARALNRTQGNFLRTSQARIVAAFTARSSAASGTRSSSLVYVVMFFIYLDLPPSIDFNRTQSYYTGMECTRLPSISNILPRINSPQSITKRFQLAQESGDLAWLENLERRYPKVAARLYAAGMLDTLTWMANSEQLFKDEDPHDRATLRGLLDGLADPKRKRFWLLALSAMSRQPLGNVARCQVCKHFFVRKRKDQKCCNHKCANLFRVRKWRKNYLNAYKLRRIERQEEKMRQVTSARKRRSYLR